MRILATTSLLLVFATPAFAQTETSPKGQLTIEGGWRNNSSFGYYTSAYNYGISYLQVDATNLGQARNLKGLSVRRDGTIATNTSYVGRTIKISMRMAHADWSKVKPNTPQQETEVLATPWTMVINDKTLNLPSYVQAPVSGTAPFDTLMQLDSQFSYNGTQALAFQFLTSPSSDLVVNFSAYPVDAFYQGPSIAPQANYGIGCQATGQTQKMGHNSQLLNYGPNGTTSWELSSWSAPANAPIVTVLGLSNPDLAFGACEKLYAQPDVTLNGMTNGNGSLNLTLLFAHKPEFVGAKLYSQCAAYDAGQAPYPVAISGGMRVIYPADPVRPNFASSSQLVAWSNPYWPTAQTFYPGSGMIFGLHE